MQPRLRRIILLVVLQRTFGRFRANSFCRESQPSANSEICVNLRNLWIGFFFSVPSVSLWFIPFDFL